MVVVIRKAIWVIADRQCQDPFIYLLIIIFQKIFFFI